MNLFQEDYINLAIGEHTHVPLNLILQGTGTVNKAAGVFQFQVDESLIKKLTQNANLNRNHVLIIGDAFVRSKIIVQSKHLIGNGIGGIYMDGFSPGEWIEHGKILKGEF